ncbi:hypothetical protein TURU_001360 [Turdus rufiventris]|nr:hypothetical protein TURU_001360 [Turdus rufiventris]
MKKRTVLQTKRKSAMSLQTKKLPPGAGPRRAEAREEFPCPTKEQRAENVLCFPHHAEEQLRSNQDPGLLDTLCFPRHAEEQLRSNQDPSFLDTLCFLHHAEEQLRSNQDPSFLDTLCTHTYLDVQKTARWFSQLVRAIWSALPRSHNWHLELPPSRRSCQFQVTNNREIFRTETLFGTRRGDSAILVSTCNTHF